MKMVQRWQVNKLFQRKSAYLFSRYGRLYDSSGMDNKTQKVYRNFQIWGEKLCYQTIRKHNVNSKIAFGIIDDPAIRAFASKVDDGYLVGVTAGAIHYFYNYCRAILHSRYAFPYIERPATKLEFDADPRSVAIYSPIEQFPSHENEEIRTLSSNMFSFCSMFIIDHEINHIIFGHLDYYIKYGGVDLIDAPLGLLNQGLLSKKAQAMEFYADSMAFYKYMIFAVQRAMSVPTWPIESWFTEGNSEVPAGPFSAYCVFRALANIEHPYDPDHSSHPPTHMRARQLQLIAFKALQKTRAPLNDAVRDFIEVPTRWAFDAYNEITGASGRNFDELVQSDECLHDTTVLLDSSVNLWRTEWKKHALVHPEGLAEISFGTKN